jgi:DNA invertase Pin-like site-specific DNA recombinase
MRNYVFGYARVSTEAQNLDRQLDALKQYGVDKIYNEKMTGTQKDRPELAKLIDRMTEGDVVVIESLSRLGRSTKDLIELTELFQSRGVHLVSLKENIDTSTSTGKLLFTLMSAIAQFERDTIADRTREGLRAARARGRMGGRPQTNHEAVRKALKLYHTGQYSIREIEELTGIKKSTLYRNLKKNTNEGR